MSNLFRLSVAAISCASLLLGCGLSPAPTSKVTTRGGQVDTFGHAHTDDSDLSGGSMLAERFGDSLRKEAIAKRGDDLVFKTQIIAPMTGRSVKPSEGPNVKITGVLRYPDFSGKLIAAANATVHVETKGLLGSKAVASVITDASGRWTAELPGDMAGKSVQVSYELGNKYWTLNKYRWAGAAIAALQPVNDTGERALSPDSENGQAALIHQIWNRALSTFEREGIPLDWWSKRIGTNWPASGDYYSFGTVNLTDAKQWDVNGHEIGHSLFFAGFNSAGGGGQHKIDECYGADLAWSEGFASFLSAVISIRRDDPDAKFEFMVPRRKPIRIENVPADVCEGHTNEWRVSAALWDVYDTHDDGTDHVAVEFKTIWGALVRTGGGPRMNDVRDAIKRIATAVPATERTALSEAFLQSGVPITLQVAKRR